MPRPPTFEVQVNDGNDSWRTVATPKGQQLALHECSETVRSLRYHWGINLAEAERSVRLLICSNANHNFR